MKILITGHEGFIGKNLVEELRDSHDLFLYEWHETERPSVEGMDWVIHLGAISSTTETDVEKVMTQNLDFSVWLYKQCCEHKVNLQWSSSASVYGPENTTFKESDSVDPRSPYAWSKYLFERHIEKNPCNDIVVQGFRYFNVYGDHEDHKGQQASPYHKFSIQAKEKNKITLFEGSDNFRRDFVPVKYVVNTHTNFFNVSESGVWNVGTGVATSFFDVAHTFNVDLEFIPMPEIIAKHYQKYTCADTSKLENTLK